MSVVITESNELLETERRFVEEAWNRGNLDVVEEMHGENLVVHWHPDIHSVEDLETYIRDVRQAFPDFHMAIDVTVLGEDMVTVGSPPVAPTHAGSWESRRQTASST